MAQTTQQIIDFINSTSQPNSITGKILAEALNGLIAKSSYAGVAKLSTDPGTPEGSVFYIATEAGTFTHFNNAVVKAGEFAVFVYKNGSWLKESVDVASNLGSPDDDADAAGSAFARINKVVDDIRKINETLEAISLSASNVYYLQLINALTTESDADAVKYAFTPLGAEEPVAPEIGDILFGKLNSVERLNRNVAVEYCTANTVGAPIRTIKYTIEGTATTLTINSQDWSIERIDKKQTLFKFNWYKDFFATDGKKLFIQTNMPIPDNLELVTFWRSKNKTNARKKELDIRKGLRWTFPQYVIFANASQNRTIYQLIKLSPIPLVLERFDVPTQSYVYSTNMTPVDVAKPFICIDSRLTEDKSYAVKLGGGKGYVKVSDDSSVDKSVYYAVLKLGLVFRNKGRNKVLVDDLSSIVPINIVFTHGEGTHKLKFPVTSLNDLIPYVYFGRT